MFTLSFANKHLTAGDLFYSKRAEGASRNMAKAQNVTEAIKHYRLALEDPASREEAAWKLLKAYYFLGCFTMPEARDRKVLFERAKKEGRAFLKEFPNNTELVYWHSVCLALWAKEVNPLVALNAGSAKETRDIAQQLIATEKNGDSIAAARGYLILGMAHHKIPKIAVILNWVNKDSVEHYLKKSFSLNPKDLSARLALAEYYKEKKNMDAARAVLLPVLRNKPRPEEFLEDERNFNKMRSLLES
ncbi:MAG: tetratricopeptide repeat protein [Fibromonadaceae bacterium]|jgi:tetratricopeptide (TPR) repeat protein|nr:tetratricopeptide repeat protein [Fibromonadaceae bacterium]